MDKPDDRQLEIYRKMSVTDKIALAGKLYWDARSLRESALRSFHPELTELEIKERVKWEFLLTSLFEEGGSEKHKRDILGLLKVSQDSLNLAQLKGIAEELDLKKELDLILES